MAQTVRHFHFKLNSHIARNKNVESLEMYNTLNDYVSCSQRKPLKDYFTNFLLTFFFSYSIGTAD